MADSTKHDIIYLQVCEDEESEWLGEVTWCQDRVNNDDVKYIRADLVKQQLADVKTVSDHNLKVYQEAAEKLRQQLAEVTQYWEAAKEDNEQKRIYTMMLQQQLAAKQAEADQLRQHVTLLRDAIVAIWTNPNWKPDTMPRALIDQLQTAYKGELK